MCLNGPVFCVWVEYSKVFEFSRGSLWLERHMGRLREWKGQREWKEMYMERHILYINLTNLSKALRLLSAKFIGGNAEASILSLLYSFSIWYILLV